KPGKPSKVKVKTSTIMEQMKALEAQLATLKGQKKNRENRGNGGVNIYLSDPPKAADLKRKLMDL
ncbi:MAG: hypothetical protein P4L69_01520, partial [Desulfosporosinus sp.]|nr:hypothetical protein [Desulfosporosinus sp.]